MRVVDDALVDLIASDPEEQRNWLFLGEHPEFQGRWIVEGFDPHFYYDLHKVIGAYKQVSPATLKTFTAEAENLGYKVAFFEDPIPVVQRYESLRWRPSEFSINSTMPGTQAGMLTFQLQGFNFLRELDGGVALWSTGTGKTVLASALLKHHLLQESFDVAWFVVKAHNKINTQRSLARLADVQSVVIKGDKKARRKQYAGLEPGAVVITNYEKFRFDKAEILPLMEDRRVFMVWDEMPAKLSSRKSQVYKSVIECLYRTKAPAVNWEKKRPSSLRQFMLSGTPIKKDPEGWFNCVRVLDPRIYGTVKEFRNEYVASFSYFDQNAPENWHKLDKMGLKTAHIVHQVDRDNDPEVAKLFPERIEEPYYIDWNERDRKIYDLAAEKAIDLLDGTNVLALIGILQMLCDAPSMVNHSAVMREAYEAAYSEFEALEDPWAKAPPPEGSAAALAVITALGKLSDTTHTKPQVLRSLLTEKHRSEKTVVYTSFNEGLLPTVESWFQDWDVTYVRYGGTANQKQAREDAFRENPDIQVFLSSDQGSDSINLPEASVVIDYDMPWGWDTKRQRNRHDRITSTHKRIRRYHLLMENSVEDRKQEIISRKKGYHDGVFSGALADQIVSAKMTRDDLLYILGA